MSDHIILIKVSSIFLADFQIHISWLFVNHIDLFTCKLLAIFKLFIKPKIFTLAIKCRNRRMVAYSLNKEPKFRVDKLKGFT